MLERKKFYGDHAEKSHKTGEMSFDAMISRMKHLDAVVLKNQIIPSIPGGLDIFFVGSLTDTSMSIYRDVDIHLVPTRTLNHSQLSKLNEQCLSQLRENEELSTFIKDEGDVKLIFTGVIASMLGFTIPIWKSSCFEILLPYFNIMPSIERHATELASQKSFAHLQQ